MKRHYIGIDGGGSNLRVVICDEDMNERARVMGSGVNPNAIGREQSAERIHSAIREAMQDCNLDRVDAVAIGIAGAPVDFAETWLRETVDAVLPDVFVVPASDNEIALVGATGERYGLLLLAGTGSVGFGINRAGESLQVGGWGYLLGDEGSGYWMGLQSLKRLIHYHDTGKESSPFVTAVQDYLDAQGSQHLIEWVYLQQENPVPVIAKVASVVLESAEADDSEALVIIDNAVLAQLQLRSALVTRLGMPEDAPLAFAGGLLTSENIYSRKLVTALGLDGIPHAKYEPVIGAALLAKLSFEDTMLIHSSE